MARKPKVIFIGHNKVGEAIEKLMPEWDFEAIIPDIQQFWESLSTGAVSNEVQVVLILDNPFFDTTRMDTSFETLISSMLPHCLLGVINYREALYSEIKERVDEANEANGMGEFDYYMISKSKPRVTLMKAVEHYVQANKNPVVAAILDGREPPTHEEMEEDEDLLIEDDPEGFYSSEDLDEESDYLGQVLAVTSSKGGSGKSTVSISLATYIAHASENAVKEGLEDRPLKVCILDLDVRDGQLGFMTGTMNPTVVQLLKEPVITKEAIQNVTIESPRLKCDLILAAKKPRNSQETPPEFYVQIIQNLRQMYDYIILDTSVNYLDPLLEKVAYPIADQIVFVTDSGINSVFGMTRWIIEVTKNKELGGPGISKGKIGFVINKYMPNVNMSPEQVQKSAQGLPLLTVVPSNAKMVTHAINMQSLEVLLRHKVIRPAIRRLAKSIVGHKYRLSDNIQP